MMVTLRLLVALAVAVGLAGCGGSGQDKEGDSEAALRGGQSPGFQESETIETPAPNSNADRLMVAYIEEFEKMTEALRSVDSEASARAAGEAIVEIAARITGRESEWEGIGQDEVAAASARYGSKVNQVQERLGQASAFVMRNPEYARHIQEAMKQMPGGSQ